MPDAPDERSLRAAAVAGDAVAWRALFDSAYDRVRAYCRWRAAGLSDLADDCEQETWLVAVRRLRSFNPRRGPFAGWVVGIAANVARGELRRRKSGPLPADCPTPCERPKRERAEAVALALASLPPRHEAALRAKYLDGQSVAEIAAATGESAKAVESLLTRARAAFRAAYPEE